MSDKTHPLLRRPKLPLPLPLVGEAVVLPQFQGSEMMHYCSSPACRKYKACKEYHGSFFCDKCWKHRTRYA
jgi:hypothetical protein